MFKVLETHPRGQCVDQPNVPEITLASNNDRRTTPYDVTRWQACFLTSQPSIGVPRPAVLFPSSIKDPSFIFRSDSSAHGPRSMCSAFSQGRAQGARCKQYGGSGLEGHTVIWPYSSG